MSPSRVNRVLEIRIEDYLESECALLDWSCEKFTSPGKRGVPDRIITLHCGHKPMVEVKQKRGKKSKLQKEDHAARKARCGELVFVPKTLEDVCQIVAQLRQHELKCPALPRDLTNLG